MADKPSTKQERAEDRAATQEILGGFRMNLDDAFLKIMKKKAGIADEPSSGRAGKTKLVDDDHTYVAGQKVENHHMDWDSMLAKLGKSPQPGTKRTMNKAASANVVNPYAAPSQNTISIALQNRVQESFTPVVEELGRFKFASAPDRREEQMNAILAHVKAAMQKVAIQEVANNTKSLYKDAFKFTQKAEGDGMRVYYRVPGVPSVGIEVTACGDFYGDEIVCLETHGTDATGYVARLVDGEIEDLTDRFKMALRQVKLTAK